MFTTLTGLYKHEGMTNKQALIWLGIIKYKAKHWPNIVVNRGQK